MVGQTVQDPTPGSLKLPGFGPAAVWQLFTSVRVAVVLIFLICLACLGGVLLVQAPTAPEVDPTGYDRWLGQIGDKYGSATGLFDSTGLFRVFSAWWFQLLLTLLAINVAVSTIDRTGQVVKKAFGSPTLAMPIAFFDRAALNSKIVVSGIDDTQSEEIIRKSLPGYRVVKTYQHGRTSYFARKFRFAPLGTLVHHAALVAMILAFAATARWGEDYSLIIAEGDEVPIGFDSNLTVRLNSFTDEYYPSGPPKDYVSNVVLIDGGTAVRRSDVRVNSPIIYKGTRLHQSFFGPAVELSVTDTSGNAVVEEKVPLAWNVGDRPFGSFMIPARDIEVFVIGTSSKFIDGAIPPGQVRLEVYRLGEDQPYALGNLGQDENREFGDLVFEFSRETQYSGFQVVRNPARPLLWISSVAFVIGLMWTLYFRPRQLWGQIRKVGPDAYEISFGAARGKHDSFKKSFEKIVERARKRAGALGSLDDTGRREIA